MKKYRIGFDGSKYIIQGKKFCLWRPLPLFCRYEYYLLQVKEQKKEFDLFAPDIVIPDMEKFDTFEKAYEEIHLYKSYFEELKKVKKIVYTEI